MVDFFFMSSRTVHYIPVLKHTKHHGIKIRKPLRISRTPRYSEVLLNPPPPQVRDTGVSLYMTVLLNKLHHSSQHHITSFSQHDSPWTGFSSTVCEDSVDGGIVCTGPWWFLSSSINGTSPWGTVMCLLGSMNTTRKLKEKICSANRLTELFNWNKVFPVGLKLKNSCFCH